MNKRIIITGSLGNISKPLTDKTTAGGHFVNVITRNEVIIAAINLMGAKAAVGSMEGVDFLIETFKGADVVYLKEALAHESFFDNKINFISANKSIGNNYKLAGEQ